MAETKKINRAPYPDGGPTEQALRLLRARPNQVVYIRDVVAETGLAEKYVGAAMSRMTRVPEFHVKHGPVRGSYVYYNGDKPPVIPEDAPHGQTIPEGKATPGLKPTLLIEEPKPEMQTLPPLPLALPHEIAVPKIKVSHERRLDYVGRLNHVAGIWRDEHGLLYVAMSLDEYINGKPGKSE